MNKTVKKWFWVWQEEKEKNFLEDMALKGFILEDIGFGKYKFKESLPQKIIYQMDFKGLSNKITEKEYLQIYEDAGWVLSARFGGWYYFSKKWSENADISIFNNNESKMAVYKRILLFLLITGFPIYYQLFFLLPNMPESKFEFPGFYFFFRIIALILTGLHISAVIKIISMYRKLKRNIKE